MSDVINLLNKYMKENEGSIKGNYSPLPDDIDKSIDCVLVDIDGTIANISHRLHHIKDGHHRNWDAFFEDMMNDEGFSDIDYFFREFAGELVFVTARPEKYRDWTIKWIMDTYQEFPSDCKVFMRKNGDFRPDYVIKKELLQEIREAGFNPKFVLDDRSSVVNMWREEGIPCWQVREWNDVENYAEKIEDNWKDLTMMYMMVGPSCSGKSFYAEQIAYSTGMELISSDAIREARGLTPTEGEYTFNYMYDLAKVQMAYGNPVIIDCTNLRRSDRKKFLDLMPKNTYAEYLVVETSLEKLLDRGSKSWQVSESFDEYDNDYGKVIRKQYEVFQNNLRYLMKKDEDDRVRKVTFLKGE